MQGQPTRLNRYRSTIKNGTLSFKPMKTNTNLSLYSQVETITNQLKQIVKQDQNQWLPDQELLGLHDVIEEYIYEADQWFHRGE